MQFPVVPMKTLHDWPLDPQSQIPLVQTSGPQCSVFGQGKAADPATIADIAANTFVTCSDVVTADSSTNYCTNGTQLPVVKKWFFNATGTAGFIQFSMGGAILFLGVNGTLTYDMPIKLTGPIRIDTVSYTGTFFIGFLV